MENRLESFLHSVFVFFLDLIDNLLVLLPLLKTLGQLPLLTDELSQLLERLFVAFSLGPLFEHLKVPDLVLLLVVEELITLIIQSHGLWAPHSVESGVSEGGFFEARTVNNISHHTDRKLRKLFLRKLFALRLVHIDLFLLQGVPFLFSGNDFTLMRNFLVEP